MRSRTYKDYHYTEKWYLAGNRKLDDCFFY